MMKKIFFLMPLLAFMLSGCLGDETSDYYSDWKKQNDDWLLEFEAQTSAGTNGYSKLTADWAPQNSVFVKWHNDRALTERNLSPLSTSTVDITYAMENIEGKELGNSFSSIAGDSIYRSRPHQNIAGMWIAMLNMHVGDSVTMVIPYLSGYGARATGAILPYSTLIYHVKMKGIPNYERE